MQHFSLIWLRLSFAYHCRASAETEVYIARTKCAAAAVTKKTPAAKPAWEYCFSKTNGFFKEKAALPDRVGESGEFTEDRYVRLLSINIGAAFQFCSLLFLTP